MTSAHDLSLRAPLTRVGCTCQGAGLPVTQIEIAGDRVGLVALDSVFTQARESGLTAGEPAGATLLAAVRLYNYVPRGSEAEYAEALAAAYAAFLENKAAGT